ncbi:ribosomal protection-like ABC-F family protein [Anaerosporobacter faecicola]|uniref:ribosomal protection-like ABC-F family protein n=1 Tax=Anaerosporobacter faecicola TaxID=2718714 RepID=UPI00143C483B|nr:ABC-F type ribosomal protection protein [Anaerosporobacter faecicola]
MSLIQVRHLTFSYEGSYDEIFHQVSFQIDTDWKLGFVGRNGRGKTTFLNLLLGKYPYSGTITSSVVFEYFPYEVKDKTKTTFEILEQINPNYEFWEVCKELSLLGVGDDIWDRPFQTLSNGERTKVLLGILFTKENMFLLIDEPTNHLDVETRDVVKEYLKKKKGFILVSHDRNLLDACIDHVLSINRTNIDVVQGNFTSWYENKQKQDAYEMAKNDQLKKEIHRLKDAAMQSKQWGDEVESTKIGPKSEKYEKCIDTRAYVGEKAKRMQQRKKNLERRQQQEIEEKAGLLKNLETKEDLILKPVEFHQRIVVEAKEIKLFYGDKVVCQNMNFQVPVGSCVALQGRNGSGKSTILKKILGEEIRMEGTLRVPQGLRISYVPQETDFLKGNLRDYIENCGVDRSLFLQFLRKLDFSREQFDKNMESFSEGQKKKVLLARSLCEQAHLYIWDEPLNFIDLLSRIQIEELILKYHPTILMVEHDKTFIEHVADQVIVLK